MLAQLHSGTATWIVIGAATARAGAVAQLRPDLRPRVHPASFDVRDEAAVASGVTVLLRRFGTVGVLVNAAGTSQRSRQALPDTSTEDWRLLMETNVTGTYLMCRALVPAMIEAGSGEIVNIGSTAGYRSQGGNSIYAASKHGLRALTEALAEENLQTGIRVTSVSPGPVDTRIWDRKLAPPSAEERSKMLRAEEIADIVVWLLTLPQGVQIGNITVTPRPGRRGTA